MKVRTFAIFSGLSPSLTRKGANSRMISEVPARLRLCPSSPIWRTWAMMFFMSRGPWSSRARFIMGASSVSIHLSRASTSSEKAP